MITPPPCDTGRVAVLIEVPETERRHPADDVADAYCVEVSHIIPGGCIIWGRYHGKWHANVSGRWLMSQFISGAEMMLHNEECGGDDWWRGWGKIRSLIEDTDD